LSDGTLVLGSDSVTVGGAAAPLTGRASIQLGVFTATGSPLELSCTSSQTGLATASDVVLAGVSLDAIAATP
jgi:hypothetical protein